MFNSIKKLFVIICIIAMFGGLLAGCGSNGDQPEENITSSKENTTTTEGTNDTPELAEDPDPVTIKFGVRHAYITDDELDRYVINPVKERYPHITVEIVRLGGENSYDNLIASNLLPDIVVGNSLSIGDVRDWGVQIDISDLIKKHDFNISRLNEDTVEAMLVGNGTDFPVGLPYTMHFNALYYNKDLFDKFAVDYPEDGMTWNEVIELGKIMTREEGGVQYRGLEPDSVYRAGSQRSLPVVDPESYESLINSDEWAKVYSMVKSIYDIPGNSKVQVYSRGANAFAEGDLAMLATLNKVPFLESVKDVFTNWDMASYPVWPDLPDTGTQIDVHIMMPTITSEHLDDAFRVMETVLSDEVQLDMARNARVSVLKGKKFEEEFGKETEILEGKNVKAIFKTKPSIPKQDPTSYFSLSEITRSMRKIMNEDLDINTALRQLEEEMNMRIAEERGFE